MLLVHADGCVFPDNVRAVASTLGSAVEVVWGDGARLTSTTAPEQVAFAVDAVDRYLTADHDHGSARPA